jgi:hypothetical protein
LEYNFFGVALFFSRFELGFCGTYSKKLNEFVILLLDLSHPTHDLLFYIYRCHQIEVGCMGRVFAMSTSKG